MEAEKELNSSMLFTLDTENWVFGKSGSQVFGFQLKEPEFAWKELSFTTFWSTGTRVYFNNTNGLVILQGKRFTAVPIELPEGKGKWIKFIAGRVGSSTESDTLFCLAVPKRNQHQPVSEHYLFHREAGNWTSIQLPTGRFTAMAVGADCVCMAIPSPGPKDWGNCSLILLRNGRIERLEIPSTRPARGLFFLPDGRLLACFDDILVDGNRFCSAWILEDGGWSAVRSPFPFRGNFHGTIPIQLWAGKCWLASQEGIFYLDQEEKSLILSSAFRATAMWSLEDCLITYGYRKGKGAHEINSGQGWTAYSIPEPAVVVGGKGRAVWIQGEKLPSKKIRISRPKKKKPHPVDVETFHQRFCSSRVAAGDKTESLRNYLATKVDSSLAGLLATKPETLYGCWRWDSTDEELTLPWTAVSAEKMHLVYGSGHCMGDDWIGSSKESSAMIAAFTGTIPIGDDGAGRRYFVQAHPESSEVFILDWLDLQCISDSISSFVLLNGMIEDFNRHEEESGVELQDYAVGSINRSKLPVRFCQN